MKGATEIIEVGAVLRQFSENSVKDIRCGLDGIGFWYVIFTQFDFLYVFNCMKRN
jgi:hypothetical protein